MTRCRDCNLPISRQADTLSCANLIRAVRTGRGTGRRRFVAFDAAPVVGSEMSNGAWPR